MNRPMRLLLLALAIIAAGCLTVGCAQGANIKKALANSSPSATVSDSPGASSPAASSPAPSRPAFSPTRTPSPRATATVQHTVTASAAPSPSSSAAPAGTASSLLWLWILLGVLLIVIVAVVVTRHSRRRLARTAAWRAQAADASARGSALYDAISLAGLQETWERADAEARWVDIQRRADDMTQLLYQLHDSAPTEEDQVRVADVLAALQAVRAAMGASHTPGGPSARQHAQVCSLLESFGAALRALRSPDVYGY